MVYSVSGCTRGVQVKLWDPLRTRAIPARLRDHDKALYNSTFTLPYLTYTTASPSSCFCRSLEMTVVCDDLSKPCMSWSSRFLPRCVQCRRGLAMRILSVCPSVCLSVTRVDCDKTVERSVQIYIPYERTFSLVFWEEEWLARGDPFNVKFESTDPRCHEIADFQPIIARSSSAVTPSEKKFN